MKRAIKKVISIFMCTVILLSVFVGTMNINVTASASDNPVFKLSKVSETDSEVKVSISLVRGQFRYVTFVATCSDKISACTEITKGTVLTQTIINEENVMSVCNESTMYATIISVPTLSTTGEYYIYTFSKSVADEITDDDISFVEDEINAGIMGMNYTQCSISLGESSVTLFAGESRQLEITLTPATGEAPIWESSDESIVTVEDGIVTAVDYGEATITASTLGGSSATCTVKVDFQIVEEADGNVTTQDNLIFGNYIHGLSNEDVCMIFEDTNLSVESKNEVLATGDTIVFKKANGDVYKTLTVVVFGDVNCDGVYDGTDVTILNCIVQGMLTRTQVGEAVFAAADCNHDGNVDELDSALLNEAGVLLSDVSQNISN